MKSFITLASAAFFVAAINLSCDRKNAGSGDGSQGGGTARIDSAGHTTGTNVGGTGTAGTTAGSGATNGATGNETAHSVGGPGNLPSGAGTETRPSSQPAGGSDSR